MFVCWVVRSLVCCSSKCVGAEYLENGWRYRLGYNGAPINNGIWQIERSRDRGRHVTRCGRATMCAPDGDCTLTRAFLLVVLILVYQIIFVLVL